MVVIMLLALIFGASAMTWAKEELRTYRSSLVEDSARTPLYLPDAEYIKLVTLGFDNFVSDILWFNTISYFGKQFLGQRDYRWLSHMCELVTKLDRNAEHVVEFCASLLSWMAKDAEKSNELLTLAIKNRPNLWRYRYLRGFNYWYFLEEKELAQREFEIASRMPGAPPFLASIASRLMVDTTNDPQTAIDFLQNLIENTNDENVKAALTDKMKRGQISRDIRLLERAVKRFEVDRDRNLESLEELVDAGYIRFIPEDPFGGSYLYEDGSVKNTSDEKGLEFFGKTAKTGIFASEFQTNDG